MGAWILRRTACTTTNGSRLSPLIRRTLLQACKLSKSCQVRICTQKNGPPFLLWALCPVSFLNSEGSQGVEIGDVSLSFVSLVELKSRG